MEGKKYNSSKIYRLALTFLEERMARKYQPLRVLDRTLLRDRNYSIRITNTEWEELKELSDKLGVKLATMIRDHVLTLLIKSPIGDPEPC